VTVSDGDNKLATGGSWLSAWFITLAMASVAVFLLPASFNVADDVGAQMILAGLDGFSPAADVPFHTQLLNSAIYGLYQLLPAVSWYGLLVLLTTMVGVSLFVRLLLDRAQPAAVRGFCLLPFAVLLGHCLYSMTFTSAALLCQLGVFLSLLVLPDHQLRRRSCQLLLLALLLLAFLWRWQLCCYVLLLLVPVVMVRPERLRLALVFAATALLLVACDRGLHRLTSPDLAESDYPQFYQLRARFHDRPEGREAAETAITAAGWTREDYRIFRELWVIHDDQKFNIPALKTFLEANQAARPSLPRRILSGLQQSFRENTMSLRIILPTLLGLCFWHWGSGSWRLCRRPRMTILALLAATAPLLFLAYFRLVPRVAIPLLLYLVCLLAILPRMDSEPTPVRRWSRPGLALLAVLVLLSAGFAVKMLLVEIPQQEQGQRQLERVSEGLLQLNFKHELALGHGNPILLRLNTGAGLRHAAMHPLSVPTGFKRVRIIPSGWQTGSPRYQEILDKLGADSGRDLLHRAVDNNEIYFVQYVEDAALAEKTLLLWTSYYKRNLNREVTFDRVLGEAGREGLFAYRLRPGEVVDP
jgi:hypothetical protein